MIFDAEALADLIADKVVARLTTHDKVLDIHQTAAYLNVSADTIYDLVNSGELPGRKVGRQWCIRLSSVHAYLSESAPQGKRRPLRIAGD